MTDAEWLRDQAERCLRLAQTATDPELADRLKARAADYLESAQTLERVAAPRLVPRTSPGRLAPQQQQQMQPKKEES
jgi:hypothetical protein